MTIIGKAGILCVLPLAAALLAQSAGNSLPNQQPGTDHQNSPAYDFVIQNGRIIDGSGNPWVSGDVAIRGDRIVKIGKIPCFSSFIFATY